MKRFFVLVLVCSLAAVLLCGCGNRDTFDTVHTYERCMIFMPDGEILEGKVDSWRDYSDGDQVQVEIDGVYYLVHSSNIVLISE